MGILSYIKMIVSYVFLGSLKLLVIWIIKLLFIIIVRLFICYDKFYVSGICIYEVICMVSLVFRVFWESVF